MTENDRPLPRPPRTRFEREAKEGADPAALMSDRLAGALAQGRLEEFMQRELPEGEHARKLALMMMGMSGMAPPPEQTPGRQPSPDEAPGTAPAAEVPPEVLSAVEAGDVEALTGALRSEHAKRSGVGPDDTVPTEGPNTSHPGHESAQPARVDGSGNAGIDAAVVDELIRIAADNDVTVDWLMLRAVKLYVAEYQKTGRL